MVSQLLLQMEGDLDDMRHSKKMRPGGNPASIQKNPYKPPQPKERFVLYCTKSA